MFSAYTIFNTKNSLYRSPFPPISLNTFKSIIIKESTPEEGSIDIDGYTYTYLKKNIVEVEGSTSKSLPTTYALITQGMNINIARKLFMNLTDYLSGIDLVKFEDAVFAIDDCLNRHCYYVLSCGELENNNLMESYEEKIYEMEMKNKELMAIREMKMRSMRDEEHSGHLKKDDYNYKAEYTYKNEYNLKNENNHNSEYNVKAEDKAKNNKNSDFEEFPITDDDIQTFIFEKIKVNLTENKVEDYSLTGEMSMYLRKEIDKLKCSHKGVVKFSPNLSKEYLRKGYLKGNRGFPVDKIIKVAKWTSERGLKVKDTKTKESKKADYFECPLSFTFWDDENIVEIEFFENVYGLQIEMNDGLLDVGDFKKGIFSHEIESPYPMILRFSVEPVVKIEIEGVVQRKCEYEVFVDE